MPIPAMLAAAAPIIGGLLSFGGQASANRTNIRLAREGMDFSERMSSTAAQRSAADYAAAGLNPALAYDRPASTPPAAVARVDDAVGRGVGGATAAAQAMAAIKLLSAQTEGAKASADKTHTESEILKHDLALRQTTIGDEPSWRAAEILKRRGLMRNVDFEGAVQPFQKRQASADALLRELLVPGARGEARFSERMGELKPGISFGISNAAMLARLLGRF